MISIPFFSIDFSAREWRVYVESFFPFLQNKEANKNKLEQMVKRIYPTKKILFAASARTIFFHVLKNNFREGDEILFSIMSFPLYVKIAKQLKLVVKFVDVDAESGLIDISKISNSIGPKTKGIVVTHLFGLSCDPSDIAKIAGERGLTLIEDCAQSYLSNDRNGTPLGTYADYAIISCSMMKVPTSLGGGVLLSDSEETNQLIGSEINDGFVATKPSGITYTLKSLVSILNSYPLMYSLLSHPVFGFLKKRNPALLRKILYSGMGVTSMVFDPYERPLLNKTQYAVALAQFQRAEEMSRIRREYTLRYLNKIPNPKNFRFVTTSDLSNWNTQYLVIVVNADKYDFFYNKLFEHGIHVMHENVWDARLYNFIDPNSEFPGCDAINPYLLRLQNNSHLKLKDIDKIISTLVEIDSECHEDLIS